MSNLQHRQAKIQAKRKTTPWREFVMEICSWQPLMFYKNKGLISRYPDTGRSKIGNVLTYEIYKTDFQIENITNLMFDFKRLFQTIELSSLLNDFQSENCNYSDNVINSKNSYLSTSVIFSENICYSFNIKTSKNIFDSVAIWKNSDKIYSSSGVIKSYEIFYSNNIQDSSGIRFCSEMIGCKECISCSGLKNQSFCINNIQYAEDEYKKYKKDAIKQGSKILNISKFLVDSEEIENTNYALGVKKSRNAYFVGGGGEKINVYDSFGCGQNGDYYGGVSVGGGGSQHIYCSNNIGESSCLYYSMFCSSCSFCLGCIGLKNKSYCILNKQYTKEERYEKVDEIFAQMDKDGTLGEFFPATMNPFYFNDTAAYLIDPTFTKEEVTAKGYLRRDEPIKVDIPEGVQTVKTSELDKFEGRRTLSSPSEVSKADGASRRGVGGEVRYIDPEIMKKVIIDEQGNAYRVIPMEYEFLMKYGLPLPRKHWLDRMKENFRIS